ncbi:protein LURP-one-related 11-like [Hordeum vulgare]|nr:protein LURP-one-related 11-like [Hordeum vulgare]
MFNRRVPYGNHGARGAPGPQEVHEVGGVHVSCSGWEEPERVDTPRRRPWFTVVSNKWGRNPCCEFRRDGHAVRTSWIVDDTTGLAVAEVKRKLTVTGVSLGEDVLTLVVEPNGTTHSSYGAPCRAWPHKPLHVSIRIVRAGT